MHDSVSNHQPHDCFLNRLFRRRSKKTSKLRFTGLCKRNSPGTGEFPAQMASNAENVSIWWRHHVWPVSVYNLYLMKFTCLWGIIITKSNQSYQHHYSDLIISSMVSQISSLTTVCLLKRLFWRRSKKTSKLRVTGLSGGTSPVTGEFPAQMTSSMENVSIWWHHHDNFVTKLLQFLQYQPIIHQSLHVLLGFCHKHETTIIG